MTTQETPEEQETIEILLVDDEPRNLDALEAILDDPSYRLVRADSADVALKLLLEHDVAAIVLDIKMPGVSGFELAQIIKGSKKFRQIPIVFLTAYLVDDKDVLAGYGSGAVDYLTKPVNPLILRHKIAVFADLFRKTRALAALNDTLEERVRQRTEQLETANRTKDDFLALISHELRTPLNAILGWSSMLKQCPGDADKVARGAEVIERNALAQTRLVEDLFDVSRIVAGKLHVNMAKMQLPASILAATEVVRPAAEAKGIRLAMQLDAELGVTFGDSERLQQVVWNLLTNAVKFTPAGGRVTVTAKREGATITLVVQDTGVGIAAEHLPHVFERFRQVDSSTTRAHGGLGLGLAIVRHLVEAHGGAVAASSEGPGKGSTFTLTLPVVATAEAAEGEPPRTSSHGRTQLANTRVLVVEDDPDALDLVRVVLEQEGASVTTARSAAEALRLSSGTFDVLVSDIGMPEMDGYALVRRIRSTPSGAALPAIALTAYARADDAEQAMRAGYQRHLAKPLDHKMLVEAIKVLVRRVDEDGGLVSKTAS